MHAASRRATPWLPPATLESPRAAEPVAKAITAWSDHWFGDDGWRPSVAFARAPDDDWTVLRQGEGADLAGRSGAVIALAFGLVGVRPRSDLNEADLRMLRRIASEALDDLKDRIDAVCAVGVAAAGGQRWRLTIGTANRPQLAIEIGQDMLAAIARRSFKPVGRSVALSSLSAAVAGQPVQCAAWLGRAELSVEQFSTLEPGDIILLDQPVRVAVPLAVAGRPSDLQIALADTGAATDATPEFQD